MNKINNFKKYLSAMGLVLTITVGQLGVAQAATLEKTGTITWDAASCSAYINGYTYGTKNTITTSKGDVIDFSLQNNASVPMRYDISMGGNSLTSGMLSPGQASSHFTLDNYQNGVTITATADPDNNPCAYKTSPGIVSYAYAADPTSVTPAPAPSPVAPSGQTSVSVNKTTPPPPSAPDTSAQSSDSTPATTSTGDPIIHLPAQVAPDQQPILVAKDLNSKNTARTRVAWGSVVVLALLALGVVDLYLRKKWFRLLVQFHAAKLTHRFKRVS